MSAGGVTALVWLAILVAGCAGYAGWPWWIGPAISATAENLAPALSDPLVRVSGLLAGLVFNVGLFGGLPSAMYLLVHWLTQ